METSKKAVRKVADTITASSGRRLFLHSKSIRDGRLAELAILGHQPAIAGCRIATAKQEDYEEHAVLSQKNRHKHDKSEEIPDEYERGRA